MEGWLNAIISHASMPTLPAIPAGIAQTLAMKAFSLFLLFCFSIHIVNAQSGIRMTGKVVDQENKGLDLALVALLDPVDSTFVKSEFTDQDGSFLMTNLAAGAYVLQVNLLGYEPHREAIQVDSTQSRMELPPVMLTQNVNVLEEVTVKAKTPYIERKIDRTVINVDALSTNAGSDALEVLERAPGITVDNNGGLILKGRSGVAVFINDKPSYLSGSELESYLRSLPAGSVKQIEVMTNPPAKYEAAGNSGVINIILKKNKLQGLNGNVSLSFRRGQYSSSNNSLNLNYNKNKIGLYANCYGGFYNSFQDLNINRYYRNEANERLSAFEQNSYNIRKGKYLVSKVGMDYYLNDNTTVGLSYKFHTSPSERLIDNTSLVSDAMDVLMQRVVADNTTDGTFRNEVYNVYLNHNIDSLGSTISVDADYVTYQSGSVQLFKNFLYDNENVLTFEDRINGDLPSRIDIYAAKTDYVKPLKDGSKLEAGLKMAYTKTDNEAIYTTTVDGVTEPDYDLSNRFLYDEWINAGYVNYTRSLGPIDIQVGLRVEATKLTGEQLGNIEKPDTAFTRKYTSAFPTFYASWKMDSVANNVLTFSYGRRIDRPYFQDLNPFVSPLDRFTFYVGNPGLLPTYSHNLSLAHTFKGKITTTLNYSKTLDGINETLEIRDGIYYSRPGNIAENQTISLSVEGSIPITKWYNFNGYAEVSHLIFKSPLYTEQLNTSGTYYYLSATNSFQFGKGWSGDLVGLYRSDLVYAQLLLKSYGQINFGLQKKILDGAGTIRLAVNDILYTRRGDGIINNLRLTDADWNSNFDSRTVTLAFSWRFGKSTLKKRRYQSNGSRDEQSRVRE